MKFRLLFNHPHQPFAHSFPDESGQSINADTLRELVKAVREFRAINFMPIGDPESDIAAHYAARYPWLVQEVREPEIAPPRAQDGPAEAIERFIREVYRSPPRHLAAKEEIAAREKVCRECKFHAPCDLSNNRELVRIIYLIAKGESPKGIGFCTYHRFHAGIACMLPDAAKRARPESPGNCWLAKEMPSGPCAIS